MYLESIILVMLKCLNKQVPLAWSERSIHYQRFLLWLSARSLVSGWTNALGCAICTARAEVAFCTVTYVMWKYDLDGDMNVDHIGRFAFKIRGVIELLDTPESLNT